MPRKVADDETRLRRIERQLAELDAERMSFDFEGAERCKAALARIAHAAALLCGHIKATPPRDSQKPRGWRPCHELNAAQDARDAKMFAEGRLIIAPPMHPIRRKPAEPLGEPTVVRITAKES